MDDRKALLHVFDELGEAEQRELLSLAQALVNNGGAVMPRYPVKESDLDSSREVYEQVNIAYYDGYITAVCETPEEYESIQPPDRLKHCFKALAKNAALLRIDTTASNTKRGGLFAAQ